MRCRSCVRVRRSRSPTASAAAAIRLMRQSSHSRPSRRSTLQPGAMAFFSTIRCSAPGATSMPSPATSAVIGTGGEKERVGTGIPAAAQGQRPQPVEYDRLAVHVLEGSEEFPVRGERVYFPIAEIADEDIAAEAAKGE